jgi:hypothetical protein
MIFDRDQHSKRIEIVKLKGSADGIPPTATPRSSFNPALLG